MSCTKTFEIKNVQTGIWFDINLFSNIIQLRGERYYYFSYCLNSMPIWMDKGNFVFKIWLFVKNTARPRLWPSQQIDFFASFFYQSVVQIWIFVTTNDLWQRPAVSKGANFRGRRAVISYVIVSNELLKNVEIGFVSFES